MSKAIQANELVVSKEDITKFLDLILIKGENENSNGIFTITKDNITNLSISPNKTVGISGTLKGTFDNIGEIGIDNFSLLKKALALSSEDTIKLHITDTQIQLKSNRTKINLALRKKEFCKNILPQDKFKELLEKSSGNPILLKKDNISTILNYYATIKPQTIIFAIKKNELEINFKEQNNEITTEIPINNENIIPSTFKIASFFIDILATINDDITLSYKPLSPAICLHYINKNIDITYLVAIIGE